MTNDYYSTDFVTALDALMVTLGNLMVDQPSLHETDDWDEMLSIVGEDMFVAGRGSEWGMVQELMSIVTGMWTFEDVPASLRQRFHEVLSNTGR